MQLFHAFAPGDALQPPPKLSIFAGPWKQAAGQRAIVEPGAAGENRQLPPFMNAGNDPSRVARIVRGGVLLRRAGDVDQVMRNAAALMQRNLIGADIEPAIDGSGIAVDDLAVESLGNGNAQ